jgi:hypothetical protein
MAKRAPADEERYSPLNDDILSAVMHHKVPAASSALAPSPKVVELTRAAQPDQRLSPSTMPEPTGLPRRRKVEIGLLLTCEEKEELDRLVLNLAARLGTQLKASHLLRALVALALNAESEIDRRAGARGDVQRPPNSDASGLLRFEWEIATIIANALRDAGLPR